MCMISASCFRQRTFSYSRGFLLACDTRPYEWDTKRYSNLVNLIILKYIDIVICLW